MSVGDVLLLVILAAVGVFIYYIYSATSGVRNLVSDVVDVTGVKHLLEPVKNLEVATSGLEALSKGKKATIDYALDHPKIFGGLIRKSADHGAYCGEAVKDSGRSDDCYMIMWHKYSPCKRDPIHFRDNWKDPGHTYQEKRDWADTQLLSVVNEDIKSGKYCPHPK